MPTHYNFSDVFISYSRRDTDFVRRIVDELKKDDRSVWVDWEDIPLSADWWSEIEAGIDAAANFVFIISPDSVASEICYKEIEYALHSNKRVIPVLYREVHDPEIAAKTHPSISSHNWIFMRESEDFDEAFRRFITTMDTDLNYVRQHSRLLVRATEWDQNSRNPSFLLTGQEINDAEAWLAESSTKEPNPTPLHSDYILASRQLATQRQRRLLIGVTAGMMISIVLAILSGILFTRAQANLTLAEQRGTVAAQQAETAIAAQDTAVFNADLAENNAATAVFNADLAENNAATADANADLAQDNAATAESALSLSERRGTQVADQAQTAVFNADLAENNAATADANADLAANNAATAVFNADLAQDNAATAESALSLSERRGTQVADQAQTAVFNADLAENNAATAVFNADLAQDNAATAVFNADLAEDNAATADANADLAANNAATADANADLAGRNEATAIAALATSEASELQARSQALAVNAQQALDAGDVDLALALSIESGAINPSLIQAQRVLSQAAPLGVRLNVGTYEDEISFYETPIINEQNPIGGGLARFHPDSNRVVVVNPDNSISMYNLDTRQEERRFVGHRERVTDIAFSSDGTQMISASSTSTEGATSGALILWNVEDARDFTRLEGHVQGVNSVAVRPGRNEFASASDDASIILWNLATALETVRYTDSDAGPLKTVRWDETGEQLYALSDRASIIRRIGASDYDTLRLTVLPEPFFRGYSPDGAYGYTGGNEPGSGSLTIWNATNGNLLREFSLQDFVNNEEYVRFVDFSRENDQHVLVYLEQWQRISGSDLFYRGNKVAVWDIFSNTEVRVLEALSDELRVTAMTYDPSGLFVLTADNDGRSNVITLRDANTGLPLRQYRGHEAPIDSMQFSPDGAHAVTISRDGNARVWDIFIDDASELRRTRVRIPVVPSENSRTPNIGINEDGSQLYLSKGSYLTELDASGEIVGSPSFVGETLLEATFYPQSELALARTSADAAYAPYLLWDFTEGESLHRFGANNGDTFSDGVFTPDGAGVILAGKGTDGTDTLARYDLAVDPTNPEPIYRTDIGRQELAEGHTNIQHVAISRDGTRLATVGVFEDRLEGVTDQEMIVIWDAELGIALNSWLLDTTGRVQRITFTPDGTSLLGAFSTPSNFMLEWDVETGDIQVQYTAHIDTVNAAVYNTDGSLALSGSDDRTVILWDTTTGQPIRSYTGHTGPVTDVVFHPDTSRIVSVDTEEVIQWQIDSFSDTVEWVFANRFVPELTCAQRLQYNVRPYCGEDAPAQVVVQAATLPPAPSPLPTIASDTVVPTDTTTVEVLPTASPSPSATVQALNVAPTATPTAAPTRTPSPTPLPRALPDRITAPDPVPLRVLPSAVSRSLPAPVLPDDTVLVLEVQGDWTRVRLVNDTEGWVPTGAVNDGNGPSSG